MMDDSRKRRREADWEGEWDSGSGSSSSDESSGGEERGRERRGDRKHKKSKKEKGDRRDKSKKKSKKHKRERKEHKRRRGEREREGDADDGRGSGPMVVEGPSLPPQQPAAPASTVPPTAPSAQRDDWMMRPPPREEKAPAPVQQQDAPASTVPAWRARLLGAADVTIKALEEARRGGSGGTGFVSPLDRKDFRRPLAESELPRTHTHTRVSETAEGLAGESGPEGGLGGGASDVGGRSDALEGAVQESAKVEQAPAARRESAKAEQAPPVAPPSEKELNQMAAKLMRAEMMGDDALAATLRARLEDGRRLVAEARERPSRDGEPSDNKDAGDHAGGRREEVFVLSSVTRGGTAIPLPQRTIDAANASMELAAEAGRRKRNKSGKEAEGLSVADMVREEMADDGSRYDADMARSIATASQYMREVEGEGHTGKHTENDDEMAPDVADLFERGRKTRNARDEERTVARAQRQAAQANKHQERCTRCLDGPNGLKSAVVSHGIAAYLALPDREPLVEGHCLIVPVAHVAAINMVDEDVWDEIQVFRKFVTKMFSSQGRDVVFVETVMGLKYQPHAVIECIPLPSEEGAMAPMYFKKAITEAGSEWSQHRKLIDTKGKGIRRSVPPGFPYFNVEFAMDGGFATVIEDEAKFNKHFGKEIVGGMLDISPNTWTRPRAESADVLRERHREFAAAWKPFDWTVRLRGEGAE